MKYWELGHLSHVNKVTTLLAIILDDVDFFEIFLLKRSFSAKAKSFVFKISPPQESAPLRAQMSFWLFINFVVQHIFFSVLQKELDFRILCLCFLIL